MFKRDLANILVIILFGAAIYLHAVPAPFHFDDFPHIVDNPHIKNLSNPGAIWNHWPSRFSGFFTFAVNYALGGSNAAGYRAVNIAIHLIGAIFAYLLVKLLASATGITPERGQATAFWAALIFACHPVQTQAVTYIVQRFASMAGALALGAVFCYFKARTLIARFWSCRHLSLYGGGIILALLAMTSKESAVAIPVLILSLELLLPRPSASFARRILYFTPYALTIAVVPALSLYMAAGHGTNPFYYSLNLTATGGTRMYVVAQDVFLESRAQYLLTQLRAFLIYARLSLLPARQSIWYDLPLSRSIFSPGTYMSLFVIISLVVLALRFARRLPLLSVAVFWFFFNLAPASSAAVIWPFLSEHHLYLPVLSWALVVGLWLGWLGERVGRDRVMVLGWLLVFCLALLTGRRNFIWGDTYRLWQDALRTSPGSAAIYSGMAGALIIDGRYEEAAETARRAIEINPRIDLSYHNLWAAYFNLGRLEDAETAARRYAEILPASPKPYVSMGMTLLKKGEYALAREVLQTAVAKDPAAADAQYWLGVSHYELGEDAEALKQLSVSLALNPYFPAVYYYLGLTYKRTGEAQKALDAYLQGTKLSPDSLLLNYNLAMLAWEEGHLELAQERLTRVLRLAEDEDMKKMSAAALSKLQSEMGRAEPGAVVLTPEE